jgi:TPP-dependent pyruvate/acetoin dehydrogenase alpha subunit
MALIREVETQISLKYPEGNMRCPTHLSIGQEAPPAVLSQYLTHRDYAVSTHRSHAHYLAKGGDLLGMLAEIHGLPQGCSKGRGGSMHLADKSVGFMGSSAIVGNSIPVGTGLGHAAKLSKSGQISVVYLGDAAVEEGVFYESANFAATAELPVLFLCENNGFSVYTDFNGRQPKGRNIYEMVGAMGVRSSQVSSYNLTELASSSKSAVDYVRKTGKPFFLEIETMRYLEHCGPNDDSHLGYRDVEAVQEKKAKDPMEMLGNALSSTGNDTALVRGEVSNYVTSQFEVVENLMEKANSNGGSW